MDVLKICFTNFWPSFNIQDNFITKALGLKYKVEVVAPDDKPLLHFYSQFGDLTEHYKYTDRIRIYFTGENDVPNFTECDYAISFHYLYFGNRHLRLPLYCFQNEAFENLRNGIKIKAPEPFSRKFCSAVISNNHSADPFRMDFIEALSNYKTVDSGGRHANNVGGPVDDKFAFCSQYKFCIAIENSKVDGYTTEKLTDALYAGCVPIYWGNRKVVEDINPESFINLNDFCTINEAVEYIRKVDDDKDLYTKILEADPLNTNPFLNWEEILYDFITDALVSGKKMVPYGANQWMYNWNSIGTEMRSYNFLVRHMKQYKKLDSIYRKIRYGNKN